jgi:ligand-binding sensor domain-containing protein/signal transduction histidine kinase
MLFIEPKMNPLRIISAEKRNGIMKISRIVIILSLIHFSWLTGQNTPQAQLRFRQITINEGLANNKVNCIVQDHSGFLWFGTNQGLSRYDGYQMTTYYDNPYDSTGLTDHLIKGLLVDRLGQLWIGMEGRGLCVLKPDQWKFEELVYDGNKHFNFSIALYEDKNDWIWASSCDTLMRIESGTHRVVNYWHKPDSPKDNRIQYIYEDSRGNLWIGNRTDGLYLFNRVTGTFRRFRHEPDNTKSISGNYVNIIYEDQSGELWIGTNDHGLNQFIFRDSSFLHISIDPEQERSCRIRSIIQDKYGRLWFGTRSGLYLKDNFKNTFTRYAHADHYFSKLGDNSVYDIFIDASDVMWIGTYAGGASYADLNQKKFVHYSAEYEIPHFLNNSLVLCFQEDKLGNLWIGTENGGLNYLDRKNGTFTFINPDPNSNLNEANVRDLLLDHNDNLWIAAYQLGLFRYDTQNKQLSTFSIPDRNINVIYMDKQDRLWLGSETGLFLIDWKSNHVLNLNHRLRNYENQITDVTDILMDHEGQLWIGTYSHGVFIVTPSDFNVLPFQDSVLTIPVNSIFEDSRKNIWFATEDGLFVKTSLGGFKHYIGNQKIPFKTIFGILEDGHGNLWISSESSGLIQFLKATSIPESPEFIQYGTDDGLQSSQFNFNACYQSHSGEMYFGGVNGFNSFNPDDIQQNRLPPAVVLTGLKIFNEPIENGKPYNNRIILPHPIFQMDTLILSNRDHVFMFEFAALHFAHPEKNLYAFRLNGFESKWNSVGQQRSATYTNIHAGTYRFEVKAANYDGIWNETGTSITVIITPPFWKTWWFRIILALLSFGTILSGYELRISSIKKQQKKLESQVQQRTEDLKIANQTLEKQKEQIQHHSEAVMHTNRELAYQKNQLEVHALALKRSNQELEQFAYVASHDLQEPLRMILSYAGLIEKRLNGKLDHDSKDLFSCLVSATERMQALIQDLLTYSRLNTDSRSQDEIDLNQTFEIVMKNLRLMIQERKAEISWEPLPVVKSDPVQLQRLFQNLISNAIKYCTVNPIIHLSCSQQNNRWIISVKDNGIGIDSRYHEKIFGLFKRLHHRNSYSGTGIGLAVCKKIVENHGGEIWVESEGDGKGCTFFFTIPCYQ